MQPLRLPSSHLRTLKRQISQHLTFLKPGFDSILPAPRPKPLQPSHTPPVSNARSRTLKQKTLQRLTTRAPRWT